MAQAAASGRLEIVESIRLRNIVRQAAQVLGARAGLLVWRQEAVGYPEEVLGPDWQTAALKLAAQLEGGQSTFLQDVAWPSPDSPPTTVLGAPLSQEDGALGWMAVIGMEGDQVSGKRKVLEAYAGAALLAIQQADLEDEQALGRRRAGELAVIADYGHLGALGWSVEATMEHLLKVTTTLMGAARGYIMLLDERKREFVRAFTLGLESGVVARRKIGEGIAGWVAKKNEPILVADASTDRRFAASERGVKDAVCVPLRREDDLIGVVLVASKMGTERFDAADLETLSVLAEYAASTLAGAIAHRETADFVAGGERGRLAEEIHDGMIQELTGTVLQLELLEKLRGRDPERELEHLHKAKERARRSLDQLRQLTSDLRLSAVKELGLAKALQGHLAEFTAETGIAVTLSVEGEATYLPLEVATNLFPIAREALLNVRKHALADHAHVTLTFGEREVALSVADKGVGLSLPETLEKSQKERKFGLLGMRERAYRIGGTLDITSARRKGTEITVRVPYRWLS